MPCLAMSLRLRVVTDTAKLAAEVQYQIDEYDCVWNDAVENVADEHGLPWNVVADAAAHITD